MKLKKLLKQLESLFDADRERLQEKEKGLVRVLKNLEERERKLEVKISAEIDDEERELLGQELSIVQLQRQKGALLLTRIREGNKQ
ncbi:hypothetical protein Ga0123462_0632 [Mariprofundus ferrinatatus]|uniref:Uncharacterized protein n=1 Tax=Mariprofundus ferrinatatus TaxID=1921087 RepID=A0A2K8L331_9PROT|nr:hypothetical protein [Mariprofundus ferrinatatus]ATX81502.1 hypothetical protein Ga0123462_0632 [Mariprofundus ferrinatatus]